MEVKIGTRDKLARGTHGGEGRKKKVRGRVGVRQRSIADQKKRDAVKALELPPWTGGKESWLEVWRDAGAGGDVGGDVDGTKEKKRREAEKERRVARVKRLGELSDIMREDDTVKERLEKQSNERSEGTGAQGNKHVFGIHNLETTNVWHKGWVSSRRQEDDNWRTVTPSTRHTALQLALHHGHSRVAEMLIRLNAGAHCSIRDNRTRKHFDCVTTYDTGTGPPPRRCLARPDLINLDSFDDAEGPYGQTAVRIAAVNGMFSIVHLLLAAGAQPYISRHSLSEQHRWDVQNKRVRARGRAGGRARGAGGGGATAGLASTNDGGHNDDDENPDGSATNSLHHPRGHGTAPQESFPRDRWRRTIMHDFARAPMPGTAPYDVFSAGLLVRRGWPLAVATKGEEGGREGGAGGGGRDGLHNSTGSHSAGSHVNGPTGTVARGGGPAGVAGSGRSSTNNNSSGGGSGGGGGGGGVSGSDVSIDGLVEPFVFPSEVITEFRRLDAMYRREDDNEDAPSAAKDGKGPSRAGWLKDSAGNSPLHYACANGHTEMCRQLTEGGHCSGFSIDDVNNDGWTALALAIYHGHAECVDVLLSSNANPLVGGEPVTEDPFDALTAKATRAFNNSVRWLKMCPCFWRSNRVSPRPLDCDDDRKPCSKYSDRGRSSKDTGKWFYGAEIKGIVAETIEEALEQAKSKSGNSELKVEDLRQETQWDSLTPGEKHAHVNVQECKSCEHSIATDVQRAWRGYFTRQMLRPSKRLSQRHLLKTVYKSLNVNIGRLRLDESEKKEEKRDKKDRKGSGGYSKKATPLPSILSGFSFSPPSSSSASVDGEVEGIANDANGGILVPSAYEMSLLRLYHQKRVLAYREEQRNSNRGIDYNPAEVHRFIDGLHSPLLCCIHGCICVCCGLFLPFPYRILTPIAYPSPPPRAPTPRFYSRCASRVRNSRLQHGSRRECGRRRPSLSFARSGCGCVRSRPPLLSSWRWSFGCLVSRSTCGFTATPYKRGIAFGGRRFLRCSRNKSQT